MLFKSLMRSGELWDATASYRRVFIAAFAVSAVLNILMLGGAFYMMLVYDSVLPSRSVPTLLGLLALLGVVYIFQGYFDTLRSSILADVANALDRQLSRRVQDAISQMRLSGRHSLAEGLIPMRDLDQIRSFLSGGVATLFDLPWMVIFIAVLFALHSWLGFTTLAGAIVIFSLTVFTDRAMRRPSSRVAQIAAKRNGAADTNLRHVELLAALGMRERMQERFEVINQSYTAIQNTLNNSTVVFTGWSKILRLALQSLVLTVGALLVIDDRASGGVIFAAAILSGRAMAPVDQVIGNWKNMIAARNGWDRITELLEKVPLPLKVITSLPRPVDRLDVEGLYVTAPGSPIMVINDARFSLKAGDACGVIGPSGAGKSSLGKALIGIWPAVQGHVRLDGSALDQWAEAIRGQYVGYLPQTVELLEGTVAQNISRFDPDGKVNPEAMSERVIAAARTAGVHDLIIGLPQGYDTHVGPGGETLPGGQCQRIGLARALFGDPFLVVLDEPNSNLDAEGDKALEGAILAIRARGGIAVVISHRPGVIEQTSHAMIMRAGQIAAFGPTREVLAKLVSASTASVPENRTL